MRKPLNNGDRQDLTSGDRSSVSVTDRMPTELPARPSFWISGIDEPSPPAVGSGDKRATNLVEYSDYAALETTAANQPVWNGEGWTFSNPDAQAWNVFNAENDPKALTLVIVGTIDPDPGTELGDRVGLFNHREGSTFIQMNYDYGSGLIVANARYTESDTTQHDAIATATVEPEEQFALVYTFEQFKGTQTWKTSLTFETATVGPTFSQDTETSSEPIDWTISGTTVLGKSIDDREFHGDIYEAQIYQERLSPNQIEGYLIPWLKDRHGIGETSAKPLSTRLPTSLPANPDLWLDASTEPAAPGDGQWDERPTNRAVSSEVEPSETNATSMPVWESEGHWEFGGDDRWRDEDLANRADPFCVFGVIRSTDSGQVFSWDDISGAGTLARCRVRNSGRIDIEYIGTDGNAGANVTSGVDFSDWDIFAARFRPLESVSGFNSSGAKFTDTAISAGPLVAKGMGVGSYGRGGGLYYTGDLRELLVYRSDLTDQQIQDEIDRLSTKWGI